MGEVNNLLHTYAGRWLADFDVNFPKVTKNQLQQRQKFLEAKEKEFYSYLTNGQATTYSKFKEFISKSLGGLNGPDATVFKQFANVNLRNSLLRLESSKRNIHTTEATIKIDSSQLKKKKINIGKFFEEANITPKPKIKGEITISGVAFTPEFGRALARLNNSKIKRQGMSLKKVTESLNKMIKDGTLSLIINDQPLSGQSFEEHWSINVKDFPWGFRKADIDEAVKTMEPSQLKEGIKTAIEVVKDYIFNTLGNGASENMKKAIKLTWTNIMGPNDQNLANFSFFSKGFINSIIGALGEFQTALLANYLKITSGVNGGSVDILGDEQSTATESFEKGKTDVAIMSENQSKWGIQVKNINTFIEDGNDYVTYIGTKIHPTVFANNVTKIIPQFGDIRTEFLTFIANYAFNETFATGKDGDFYGGKSKVVDDRGRGRGSVILQKFHLFLLQEVEVLMNLTVDESIPDTVSFYVIGGNHLLPASMLVKAIRDSYNTEASVLKTPIISSSLKRQTDSEFHREYKDDPDRVVTRKKKKEQDKDINLVSYKNYWTGQFGQDDSWAPTSKNTIDNLVSSRISINSGFNYKKLLDKTAIFAKHYIKLT